MARPRAADHFATIRARMEQLRRERMQAARDDAAEPTEQAYRYARSKSAVTVAKAYMRPLCGNRFLRSGRP
jgi:hypothetical protein